MLRQARSSASQPLRRALVVLLSFVVITCSSPTDPPEGRAEAIKADPFAEASVQATISLLAQAGIATYQDADSAAPLVAVTEPVSPVKLLHEQVRAMALEAHYGAGIEGSQLDALVDTEPDMAPPSYILAAYVSGSETAGAKAARTLMGGQDWQQAPIILYPQLVMVLFTADVLGARASEFDAGPIAGSVMRRGVQPVQPVAAIGPLLVADTGGYCSRVMEWINTALRTVFDALRLGESSNSVANFFAQLWNTVVALVEEVVTAIVKRFTQFVLDAIGRLAAIVATVANVVSLIRPWTVTVKAAPFETYKGIAGIREPEKGSIAVTVRLDGLTEWPKFAADCARTAGRPLPNLKPEGAQVTWERVIQNPPDLIREGLRREALDANASAQLDFVTLVDQVEKPYKTYPGAIVSRIEIERPGLRELLNVVQTELWQELPTDVQRPLWSILGPSIIKIQAEIVRLVSTHSSGAGVVFFHVQDQPTPSPIPPTPSLTPSPRLTPTPTPPATPRPDACRTGCAMSNGDPHIITVDDTAYDFQAAGEFVLLRSADGAFELQARQEPYSGSGSVSVNTAVAMRAGARRINVGADQGSQELLVSADGVPLDISAPVEVDGVVVSSEPSGVAFKFADGTRLWLSGWFFSGILVTLEPSGPLRAEGTGVMGPVPGGISLGLPALPDGSVLPPATSVDEYDTALYGAFADAWRVTAETSLFDYPPGASTETYTRRGFPVAPLTLEDLTPEQRAAGEAACGHIRIEVLRDQCIFDVAVTGDSGYGGIYDISATLVETGSLRPSGEQVRVVNFYSNDTGPTALDVYGWSDDGAALLATVPYGEASAWFDPGSVTEHRLFTRISIQRQGEPVNEWALNLYDLNNELVGGVEKTIVISAGDPDGFGAMWVGGREAVLDVLHEKTPHSPLINAPPDGALLFLDLGGLVYTHPGVSFFTSAGKGCLTQPDIPTLAQLSGVRGGADGSYSWGYEGPLAVEPGVGNPLTLHAGDQQTDPFTVQCDTPPIHGPVPFNIAPGGRSHFLLYAVPGENQLRSLVLPFGD